MDADVLFSRLETAGVIATSGESGDIVLTDSFRSSVSERRSSWRELGDEELADRTAALTGSPETARILFEPGRGDRDCIYVYAALDDRLADVDVETKVQLTTLLNANDGGTPRDDGAPEAFLPVRAEDVPSLANAHYRAIVYIWREDCEPCDIMRDHFDDIFEEAPEDIALFAAYGPSAAEFLHDEYGVVGAPTTLFLLDGQVDCRLIRAHYPKVVRTEVEKLRELG